MREVEELRSHVSESDRAKNLIHEAVNASTDTVVLYDRDGKILFTNDRYHEVFPHSPPREEITNYTLEDLLRRSLKMGMVETPLSKKDPVAWIRQRIEEQTSATTRTGETRHSSGRIFQYRHHRTSEGGVVILQTDITGLKQAEALQRGRGKAFEQLMSGCSLNEILTTVVNAVEEARPGTVFVFTLFEDDNKKLRNIISSGASEEFRDAVGKCDDHIIATSPVQPEQLKEIAARNGIQSCITKQVKVQSGKAAGVLRMYYLSTAVLNESDRMVIEDTAQTLSISIDRHQAAQQIRDAHMELERRVQERTTSLRESEERYQKVIEQQSELVSRFDADGTVTFINEAYCKFVGKDKSELLGTSLFHFVAEEDIAALKQFFIDLAAGKADPRNINGLHRHDGEIRYFEWLNAAFLNDDGEVIEYQSVGRDITERKAVEEALHRSEEKAIQIAREAEMARMDAEFANEAKSNFLATMSHEIRTPLNGILGMAQLLSSSFINADQKLKINTILSSGRSLQAIINDVLDMSKIEAGFIELEESPFSLSNSLSTIVTPFRNLTDEKGIKLTVTTPGAEIDGLKGDSVRLRQVIWNLLSNSIKFTHQGEVQLNVQRASKAPADMKTSGEVILHIQIKDTGIGISRDRLDSIFEPFTQEDTSITRQFGGTGLGLTIITRIIDIMGGTLEVESEQGAGSCFDVYLPFSLASKIETLALQDRQTDKNVSSLNKLDILIVEDNDINAMIASAFVEQMGHATSIAQNGKLAVEAVEKTPPDLILMDVHMPVMDGVAATRKIRQMKNGKLIPIIGLTAEAFVERHKLFREAGMNDVLSKPYTEAQLSRAILEHRRDIGPTLSALARREVRKARLKSASQTPENDQSLIETPIGDEESLANNCRFLGQDKIFEILRSAPDTIQQKFQMMQEGLKNKDSKAIKEASHSLKGTGGTLFASRLFERAARIEELANDFEAVENMMVDFEETVDQTIRWWVEKTTG